MKKVVPLERALEVALYGSKAVGLGQAIRDALPVPSGIALSGDIVEAVAAGDMVALKQIDKLVAKRRMDEGTAAQVRGLLTKGAAGGWIGLETDQPQALFEKLVAQGVDVTDEISEKDYGTDFGVRDPFGNRLRIGHMQR